MSGAAVGDRLDEAAQVVQVGLELCVPVDLLVEVIG
jgi:hypothetical protein